MAYARSNRVTFATYNVLAPPLCTEECYVLCTRDALDPEKRFERLLCQLEDEMAKLSVIALQEVTHEWAVRLRAWFHLRGYTLYVHLYYKARYGHMGVGIAFPHSIYELAEDVGPDGPQGFRLMDAEARPCSKDQAQSPPPGAYFSDGISEVEVVQRPTTPPPQSVWNEAQSKVNGMLMFSLRRRGSLVDTGFLVATYHMPCAYDKPQVMMIHGMAVMHAVQKRAELSGGIPFVLMGDFNTKPCDPLYILYTHMIYSMDAKSQPPPPPEELIKWPRSIAPADTEWFFPYGAVQSAHAAVNSREPDFTNHSYMYFNGTTQTDAVFSETLDYIFLSKGWHVDSVKDLPTKDSMVDNDISSLPTEYEPSDHIMVCATATILNH